MAKSPSEKSAGDSVDKAAERAILKALLARWRTPYAEENISFAYLAKEMPHSPEYEGLGLKQDTISRACNQLRDDGLIMEVSLPQGVHYRLVEEKLSEIKIRLGEAPDKESAAAETPDSPQRIQRLRYESLRKSLDDGFITRQEADELEAIEQSFLHEDPQTELRVDEVDARHPPKKTR